MRVGWFHSGDAAVIHPDGASEIAIAEGHNYRRREASLPWKLRVLFTPSRRQEVPLSAYRTTLGRSATLLSCWARTAMRAKMN
jgi:hypothetical protein